MYKLFVTFLAYSLLAPSALFAVGNLESALGNLEEAGGIAGTAETGSVETLAGRIINAALTLIGTIFFVLMVYAGYLWLTSRGNEQQVEKAKTIITTSVIGLMIVVSAYAVTVFVTGRFSQ